MYGEENGKGFGKNPNMIWIFADQLRAQALGCNRDKNVHTPNIDMLSQTGIFVEGAVLGMPLCCPFRGSLLTSLYPQKRFQDMRCVLLLNCLLFLMYTTKMDMIRHILGNGIWMV